MMYPNKWKNDYRGEGTRFAGNYSIEKQPFIEQAIKETGLPVFVHDVATDNLNRIMPGYVSVWTKRDKNGFCDLSAFWKVYQRLVTEGVEE